MRRNYSYIQKGVNEDLKQRQIFKKWLMYDRLSTFFALVGLIITIVSYEQDVFLFKLTVIVDSK